jgi:hypothetical protein
MTFCEKVIVEEESKNVTLVNCFSKLTVPHCPSPVVPLIVFAVLSDGQGKGTIELLLKPLQGEQVIGRWQAPVQLPDRSAEARVRFGIRDLSFPAPGKYQFTMLVDGEWIAQRNIEVICK